MSYWQNILSNQPNGSLYLSRYSSYEACAAAQKATGSVFHPDQCVFVNTDPQITSAQQAAITAAAEANTLAAAAERTAGAQLILKTNYLASDTAEWGSNAAYTGALNETNAEIMAYNNTLANQPKANASSSLQPQLLSASIGLSIKTLITVVVIIILLYMVLKK